MVPVLGKAPYTLHAHTDKRGHWLIKKSAATSAYHQIPLQTRKRTDLPPPTFTTQRSWKAHIHSYPTLHMQAQVP